MSKWGRKRLSITSEQVTKKKTKGPQTLDPCMTEGCEVVSKALLGAEHLPLSAREMLASAVPTSLMVHKDLRIPCQDRVVQMLSDIFQEIESRLQQSVCQKEAMLETLDAMQVEREATSTKTQAVLQEACETARKHAEELRKDAMALKQAEEDLEQKTVSLDSIVAQMTKIENSKARITDVMTQSFTPLRDGSADVQVDAKRLVTTILSVAKEFELEPSLLTTLPVALNQTFEKRSPFESLVLQQFEIVMLERSAKLEEEIRTSASLKTNAMVSVNDARASRFAAKEKYDTSLAALKHAQSEQKDAQATHEDAVQKAQQGPLERDAAFAVCESAKCELLEFRRGPLTLFHDLEERVSQAPTGDASVAALSEVVLPLELDASMKTVEPEWSASGMANNDEMEVCEKVGVAEKAGAQKSEEPIIGDKAHTAFEKMETLDGTSPHLFGQPIGAVAGG